MHPFLLLIALFVSTVYANAVSSKIDHIIVVYLENRSFDNLFRGFEGADTSDHPAKPYALQRDRNTSVYVRLSMGEEGQKLGFPVSIANEPFLLDQTVSHEEIIPDMVHRFYQG